MLKYRVRYPVNETNHAGKCIPRINNKVDYDPEMLCAGVDYRDLSFLVVVLYRCAVVFVLPYFGTAAQ